MKNCDLCGIEDTLDNWHEYNSEHNLMLCSVCMQFAKSTNDNDRLWEFGNARREQLKPVPKIEPTKKIGKKGSIETKGLQVEVIIKNVKSSYGKIRYQVTPVAGKGEVWTESVSFFD